MVSVTNFYGPNSQILTAKFSLISSERFQVDLSNFDQDTIEIFKSIPSRNYDSQTRTWSFLIKDYDSLLYQLQNLRAKLKLETIPTYVINCIKAKFNEVGVDFNKIDQVLVSTLLPFQIDGLKFGVDKRGRCLIADDMGLGKTFQALAIAHYYKEDWPLLIVTTSTMKTQWEETISNYLPSISIMQVQYMITTKDYIGEAKILIVSYDLMSRSLEKLLEKKFGVIIMDESHILKSHKSKCYQAASTLADKARRVILLSGTPALSRPSELYTQLSLLDKKFFGSYYTYGQRYCDGKTTKFGWDCTGHSNLQELEVILAKKFMIRRTKQEVMQSLPNKKQEIVTLNKKFCELSPEDQECLKALENKYINQKGAGKHAALLTFFSETAKIKIPAICSYIVPLLANKEKFLLFAHHQCMLNAVEDVVKRRNLKYIRIDGNTTTDQRKYFINKFQVDENYICAILSITAANAGITLTAAKLVLFAELHWNPSIISQAEARAHRIGQEDQVVVQYLLCPGTADDSIWPLLQEKQRTLNAVGLCRDSFETVTVKKHNSENNLISENLKLKKSNIRDYLTPEKKRKVDIDTEDVFNDGFDELLSESTMETEALLDDGLDDLLCHVDF